MANGTYVQMDNKVMKQEVLGESFENPYNRFIVDATEETGDFVVENAIGEMTAQGASTSILADGETPNIAEVSYTNKRKENYIYNVSEEELKSASASKEAYNKLEEKINGNLDQQDLKNCYKNFPKILLSDRANFKVGQIVLDESDLVADIPTNLKKMRADIDKIKESSNLYNSYAKTIGGTTYEVESFSNRPIIFIKKSYLDSIEIDYASGVFNLDKIRVDADIVPVPTFYSADGTTADDDVLWLTTGQGYAKIYKTFEKRARLEDVRSFSIGKGVTYLEFVSKLVPAILHTTEEPAT